MPWKNKIGHKNLNLKRMYEVEAKVWVKSEKEWLAVLEITKKISLFQEEVFKEDTYFGLKGKQKALFRLRTKNNTKHEITIKDKVIKNGIETSKENSFEINDLNAFLTFTQKLGLEVLLKKRKKSLIYQKNELRIELNQVEGLGNFLEIEILSQKSAEAKQAQAKITAAFKAFGYTEKDFEPLPYLQLILKQY